MGWERPSSSSLISPPSGYLVLFPFPIYLRKTRVRELLKKWVRHVNVMLDLVCFPGLWKAYSTYRKIHVHEIAVKNSFYVSSSLCSSEWFFKPTKPLNPKLQLTDRSRRKPSTDIIQVVHNAAMPLPVPVPVLHHVSSSSSSTRKRQEAPLPPRVWRSKAYLLYGWPRTKKGNQWLRSRLGEMSLLSNVLHCTMWKLRQDKITII